MSRNELIEVYEERRLQAVRRGNDADAIYNAFAMRCLKKPKDKGCESVPPYEKSRHPKTAFVLLEFEAANPSNVKLPGYFSCRINVFDDSEVSNAHIMIATTVSDQLGKQLRAASDLSN